MFLDIGHAVINADQIARVDDVAPDEDGARSVRITLKDGGVQRMFMTLEEVKEQLSSYIVPATVECWMIVSQVEEIDEKTIGLNFRSSQIVAFRWSPRWKLMEPIDAVGEVDSEGVHCGILQSDGTVREQYGVYGCVREWKDSVAEEFAARGKTVRRLDLEPDHGR